MRCSKLIAVAPVLLLVMSCARTPPAETARDMYGNVITVEPPRWQVNESIYQEMARGSGRIEISVDEMNFKLFDASNRVAIETDCSTGMDGHETPKGSFRLLEMKKEKRSNLYGKYISKETGEIVVERSWEVSGPPPGTVFQGTSMPYWMRVTWGGVGIHVGKFPRGYNSSFGCIRMPEEVMPLVYAKCRVGTPVRIR